MDTKNEVILTQWHTINGMHFPPTYCGSQRPIGASVSSGKTLGGGVYE